MCLNAQPVGNMGGYSYLYLVENTNQLIQVGSLEGKYEQSNRVYSEDGIYPTIMSGSRKTCSGGYIPPKILINNNKIL